MGNSAHGSVSSTNYGDGGGILAYGSSFTLNNCTISNNSTYGSGGGISVINNNATVTAPTINNSIIWGNTSIGNGKQIYTASNTTINNSCYSNGSNDVYGIANITLMNCTTYNPEFINAATNDFQEGVNSFIEKRKPEFRGD